MQKGVLKVDPRTTVRNMRMAIQGDIGRALVELITNADDSYLRLEQRGNADQNRKIDVLYKKEKFIGRFAVRDYAEGMTYDNLIKSFSTYGASTSGLMEDISVRGYFGLGAKDALATMINGHIVTFKDGMCTECHLAIQNEESCYEIHDSKVANSKLRVKHGIPENGTIAYFSADSKITGRPVPQISKLQEILSKNYMLRKIMSNVRRKINLINIESSEKRRLRYHFPEGTEVFTNSFDINYKDYKPFNINVTIWRSEHELMQVGDGRDGGLLVVDDHNVVLDISLYKYNNEPLAKQFFGEVAIGNFRELLKNEEPVLNDKREGLAKRHQFCKELIHQLEKILNDLVQIESERKKRKELKLDSKESKRYKDGMSLLNEIAKDELEAVVDLTLRQTISEDEYPPNGFSIFPSSAEISAGKKGNLELRYDTKVVRPGSQVRLESDSASVKVHASNFTIPIDEIGDIFSKRITIEGIIPNEDAIIKASAGIISTESRVTVLEEKELLLKEGMLFQPESITLRPGQPKKVYLLVYIKIIKGGCSIKLSSDNESINLSKDEIQVAITDAVHHMAKYEIEIWGDGIGQNGIISAECEDSIALLDVKIRSKQEKKPTGPKGMFNPPKFSDESQPQQRSSFSKTSGQVIIYINFPSVKHYLGENREHSNTLSAQVVIADLLAEQCFHQIAKQKIEKGSVVVSAKNTPYLIERDKNELSFRFGKKLHKAFVDQQLLKEQQKIKK